MYIFMKQMFFFRGEKTLENKTQMLIAVVVTAIICIAGTYVIAGGEEKHETITITGSTTVQPLMTELQEEFQQYSNITMNIAGGGSGAGATAAMNGTADIGMLSRDLKSSETGLVATVIALDGVIILTDKNAGITDMTLEQLAKIFSGEITNWKQVGGADMAINPIIREDGSGTRDCLDTILGTVPGFNTDNYSKYSTQASTGAMIAQVQSVKGSIGYANLGAISGIDSSKVSISSVEGVEATAENVQNGTYEISRNLILVTKGEPSGCVEFLMIWILSEQGQKIVEAKGFVPIA